MNRQQRDLHSALQRDMFLPPAEIVGGQWFTAEWAAQALVERFLPDLTPRDLVCEPAAGRGAFLKAIPDDVPCFGVELDPDLARQAATNTGRPIIGGDFRTVALPPGITAVVGNPPFEVRLIESFLRRAQQLPECQRVGFLLPAYACQTHHRVVRWLDTWSLRAEIIPRRLFPRLRLPLLFVLFTRDRRRSLVGFALYQEAVDFGNLTAAAKDLLVDGRPRRGVWRALVEDTLQLLGGEAALEEIYQAIEPRRPTPNAWWREKVRQQLQNHCEPVSRGRWRCRATREAIA